MKRGNCSKRIQTRNQCWSILSFFEFAETEPAYSKIEPLISKLIAECYEEVCRQWIRERSLEFHAANLGRQWSSAYEIDVAAVNAKFELTVFGECKWSEITKWEFSFSRN